MCLSVLEYDPQVRGDGAAFYMDITAIVVSINVSCALSSLLCVPLHQCWMSWHFSSETEATVTVSDLQLM